MRSDEGAAATTAPPVRPAARPQGAVVLAITGGEALYADMGHFGVKPIRLAWQSAVGGDLSMPPEVVPGPRPVPVRMVNAYLDRYLEAAQHDAAMSWHFLKVTGFDESALALLTPHALRRIVGARGRRGAAERVPAGAG